MPVTIRAAVPDDIAAILVIEQQAEQAAHWTHKQYERRGAGGCVFVAEGEGGVAGFLCARVVDREWEIENIAVAEVARRRGVADGLLNELLRRARSKDAAEVWLEVRESNQPARQLYEKHHFREVGRRRMYYKNPDEDAVLYKLEIGLPILP